MTGVIGEPEIRRRPEPVNRTLTRTPLPVAALDVAPLDGCHGEWLLLTTRDLVRWHAGTGEITARWEIVLPGTEPEREEGKPPRYRLHASPDAEFAVIAVDYRQHGVVIDLAQGRVTMMLDRGAYHVEQTPFPVAFVRIDGQLLLVHATAWNRVDLSDPGTGVTITPRQFPAAGRQRPAHYLDYFYGALYAVPDGGLIVSDGWVWSPVGMPRVWDARSWRHEYVYEPEDGASAHVLRQVTYYRDWDHPMCWLDDRRLAVSGIGTDDVPGVEIYDVQAGTTIARFAGPVGELHGDRGRLYASSPGGLHIWDIQTGESTGTITGFVPTRYHAGNHELAAIDDGVLTTWSTR